MKKDFKIVLTGGGTAGHVMPHLALLPSMYKRNWKIYYIGSSGIERSIISSTGIRFHSISAGKLRRYFSLENIIDVFKVFWGCLQSFFILLRLRPQLIFSKGGYVSVPVALSGWLLRIPVVAHESDLTPGLANKLVKKFCKKVLYNFPETQKYLPNSKGVCVGSPVRSELFNGNKENGYLLTGFKKEDERKIILVMGGSLGADKLNKLVVNEIDRLLDRYRIIHLTGKGKKIIENRDGYVSFDFLGPELKDIFSITDLVIARAGANSIFEFLALNKPMLLIPLEVGSRGDQLENAESFVQSGFARLKREYQVVEDGLFDELQKLDDQAESMISKQKRFDSTSAINKVMDQLDSVISNTE